MWALFLFLLFLGHLERNADYLGAAVVVFVIALLFTETASEDWYKLHPNDARPPAIEQHK